MMSQDQADARKNSEQIPASASQLLVPFGMILDAGKSGEEFLSYGSGEGGNGQQ